MLSSCAEGGLEQGHLVAEAVRAEGEAAHAGGEAPHPAEVALEQVELAVGAEVGVDHEEGAVAAELERLVPTAVLEAVDREGALPGAGALGDGVERAVGVDGQRLEAGVGLQPAEVAGARGRRPPVRRCRRSGGRGERPRRRRRRGPRRRPRGPRRRSLSPPRGAPEIACSSPMPVRLRRASRRPSSRLEARLAPRCPCRRRRGSCPHRAATRGRR